MDVGPFGGPAEKRLVAAVNEYVMLRMREAAAEPLAALREIYDGARYVVSGTLADGTPIKAGFCRWCGAPPPDGELDHDIACPAAKAGYVLDGRAARISGRRRPKRRASETA